jgi:hypothetical protein
MNFFRKHHRFLFYSSWLILALAQSASTELIADEAYYWVYSKFPAWGYFDHPPMIAVLIKAGYLIFHSELGVRLVSALLSTFTILITESLTERKNPFLFYTIVLSIGVLQVAGFLAVPDTPLLFFTALFFYVYRLFIRNSTWQNALLFGLAITLLFYTKYHGLLIVLLTIVSNIRLLSRWQLWLAAFVAFVLYSPHLYWQWQHDWISFRYHLFESNVSTYRLSYTTDYLLGQLLLAGPLAGILLLPAAFIHRSQNQWEKALKFVLIGIYAVFLFSSFRGKVEVNWSMPALISLVVLSHQFIIDKISWIKPLKIISFVSLLLIIAGRLYLVVDIGPDNSFKGRFHNNDLWAKDIKEKTGETPVVFYSSYQRSSLFWFYSGIQSHSHNSYWDRRSNYNFWPTERNLLGKKVFIADIYNISSYADSVRTGKGLVGISADTGYAALGGIKIVPEQKTISIADDFPFVKIRLSYLVPGEYRSFLQKHPELYNELVIGAFNGKKLVKEFTFDITAQDMTAGSAPREINLPLDKSLGAREIRFGIRCKNYFPTHNSKTIQITSK